MSNKVLVLLAGSGAKDGSEIREAVLTLTAIEKAGLSFQCTAPNKEQADVVNFIDDTQMAEKRNVLTESARIARGDILDLSQVKIDDYCALAIPGGFGVAKNLCSFAFEGPKASVDPEAKRIIQDTFKAKKPIMAVCIAPALVALSLQDLQPGIKLTLGQDKDPMEALKAMSAEPCPCPTREFTIDEEHKIVSTPAYMHGDSSLLELDEGINKAVQATKQLIQVSISA
ncbi:MAG: isoprenoid biosynthesis glyoxalase ElbB [Candidatus Caenarcaniphilales bacterium]|nr:isoprenoid biosynthesis glyoxalase ElbB [Candidatus Caenarcaniphilales bacterium]